MTVETVTYERSRQECRLSTGKTVVGYPVTVHYAEPAPLAASAYGVVVEVREDGRRRGWAVVTWSGRTAVTVDASKRIGPAMRDALAMLAWKLGRASVAA